MIINTSQNATGYCVIEVITKNNQSSVYGVDPTTFTNINSSLSACPTGWTCDFLSFIISSLDDGQINKTNVTMSKPNVVLGWQDTIPTLYSTQALVRTAYHEQNITGYILLHINNTDSINYTVTFDGDVTRYGNGYWTNTTPKKLSIFIQNNTYETHIVNLTLDAVYEDSYVPTWETTVGDKVKHTYLAKIIVRENTSTKTLPIYYKIPKSRLTDWDSRVSDPAPYSTINDSSTGVTIVGEEETGYITVKVDTTYSTSSLSEGTWYWQVVYYTEKEVGAGGGAGGGAGAPAAPTVVMPILFEVTPDKFDFVLGTGIETETNLMVFNREDEPIVVQLKFEGDTEIVSTDFKIDSVEPQSNLTIPLKIKGFSKPIDKKAIIVVDVKKGLVETIKEVPLFVKTVKLGTKKIGETCYANEECETNACKFENGKGVCIPVEEIEKIIKKPVIPKWVYYVIIFLIILALVIIT
jgi:hypothetical protein